MVRLCCWRGVLVVDVWGGIVMTVGGGGYWLKRGSDDSRTPLKRPAVGVWSGQRVQIIIVSGDRL